MDLTINGVNYKTGKLPAFPDQFHITRKLAPALWAWGKVSADLSERPDNESLSTVDAILSLGPVAEVIAKMSNEDSEYIIGVCLAVCSREQGTGWAKVRAGNGKIMFDDIDVPVMMQLAAAVIRENMGGFFPNPSGKTS
jgi:hypothetical protein